MSPKLVEYRKEISYGKETDTGAETKRPPHHPRSCAQAPLPCTHSAGLNLTSQPEDKRRLPAGQLRTWLTPSSEDGDDSVTRRQLGKEEVTGFWEKKKTKANLP